MLRVRVQEVLGAVAARSGLLTDALARLTTAADQAMALDPDVAVVLLADAINACFYLGDSDSGMAAADRVEALLPTTVSVRARILGLIAAGSARVIAGRGGMPQIREAVALLGTSGELQTEPRRVALVVLGPLLLRESSTGRDLVRHAVEDSRRLAAIGALPGLLFYVARDHATTDQWPAAGSEYHESIRLARETGQLTELAASLAGVGWLEGRQGDRAGCLAHLAESAKLCDEHEIHLFSAWSFFGLGDLEFGSGSAEAALLHYDNLASFLQHKGIRDVDLSPEPERVETLLRLGRLDEATSSARRYLERAQAKGQPWALARACRAGALTGPDEDIDEGFAAAMALHGQTLDAFERAKSQLAYGARLRRIRRRVDAREPLRAAFETFDRLGAKPYAALTAVEIRATGERPQRRGASLATGLTPQERQIASLLASGRSTREAATALFLSPKTVEYHLRHVYTKLAVHSREALAQKLSEDANWTDEVAGQDR
jgi:DNA-binding CsgD family transcriptional regulator